MPRTRLDGLLARIETVEMTDSVPAPETHGIQLDEHIWASIETDYLERNQRDNAMGNRMGRHGGAQPAGPFAKLNVTFALKGTGVAYAAATRPECDVLLRICGMQATVDATVGEETVTYVPRDDGHESASIYAYSSGSRYILLGCRGRITGMSFLPARITLVTAEIWGVLPAVPTDVALPAIVYPRRAILPPVTKAQDLTLGAYSALFRSVTWQQGSEVVPQPRGGATEGHAGYAITDYDPQLRCQIDSPLKSAFNPWQLERAGTEFEWELAWGDTQYNQGRIFGNNGQIIRIPQTEDSGLAMLDLNIRCLHGDTDPGFTLEFS